LKRRSAFYLHLIGSLADLVFMQENLPASKIRKRSDGNRRMRVVEMKTLEVGTLTNLPFNENMPDYESIFLENRHLSDIKTGQYVQPSAATASQIEKEVNDLLHLYSTTLYRYALSLSWDKALAQDGIQEAFLRFIMVRIRGQKMQNPRAWLFRVLRNYLHDCHRKSSFMPAVALKEAVQISDACQDVEAGYLQDEAFRRALAVLSPREQECLQLRFEGFGYEEIAQILQITAGTVGTLLARGLKKIRNAGQPSEKQ